MTAESLPTDKLIGEILANRYQILERLGEGAMGVVYKARHIKVGRTFAVKVLHTRLLEDPKVALRFAREAELAGRLRHANVVGVVDVGELDGTRYMVMDFAEGPDLAQLLGEAPMPPARVIHLVRQILEGLYHAHEQGLIHRDLKPENVIVERDNHGAELPRIVDFGIAILRDGGNTEDSHGRLTTNGLVLGTPHYMAPEQAVADPIDHRIDLFALGIMIYEMLSGQLPFEGSGAEVARANLLLDPPPISQRVAYLEVDPLLEAFSRRLMAKKPNDRPATAKAARDLLDLVDRDRAAAAIALGLPAAVAGRQPAMTQPVTVSQVLPAGRALGDAFAAAAAAASAPETRRLRATPTPNSALPMADMQGDPAFVPNAMTPPPFSAMQQPMAIPPVPMAYSGSGRIAEPNTAVQAPLPWPHGGTKWRWGIIAGIAGGVVAIAIVVAVIIGGKSADQVAAPPVAPTVAAPAPMAPTGPAAPTGSAASTASTAPAERAVANPAPAATPETEMPPEPVAVAATAKPVPRVSSSSAGPVTRPSGASTHPGRPEDKANALAMAAAITSSKPGEPAAAKPADTPPPQPAVATPVPARPEAPAAPTKTSGVSSKEISQLYYNDVPAALRALPADQAQDLNEQFRRYNIMALMTAPQADRDKAAVGLSQILQEARRRKASLPKSP